MCCGTCDRIVDIAEREGGDAFMADVEHAVADEQVEHHHERLFATVERLPGVKHTITVVDLTPYGRQETWEHSPEGWPQKPPYEWMRLADSY
jgi:predicted dithiol-disulfide oxidoreductase (DUF899 family)